MRIPAQVTSNELRPRPDNTSVLLSRLSGFQYTTQPLLVPIELFDTAADFRGNQTIRSWNKLKKLDTLDKLGKPNTSSEIPNARLGGERGPGAWGVMSMHLGSLYPLRRRGAGP